MLPSGFSVCVSASKAEHSDHQPACGRCKKVEDHDKDHDKMWVLWSREMVQSVKYKCEDSEFDSQNLC